MCVPVTVAVRLFGTVVAGGRVALVLGGSASVAAAAVAIGVTACRVGLDPHATSSPIPSRSSSTTRSRTTATGSPRRWGPPTGWA